MIAWLLPVLVACNGDSAGPNAPDIPEGPELIAISAGAEHTCAVTAEGVAYCWGDNAGSQLGVNNVVLRVPRPARVLTDVRFTSVSAGPSHTCGLATDGVAYCWGTGVWGRLDRPTPVTDAPLLRSLAGRWTHNCGVAESGSVVCWGTGESGQLGTGTVGPEADRAEARPVEGLVAEEVVTGNSFTCALDETGGIHCWGVHDAGQLGIGGLEDSPCLPPGDDTAYPCAPTPRMLMVDFDATALAAGFLHACALDAAGTAHCWGDNDLEQLGREMVEGRCDWAGDVVVDRPCSRSPLALDGDLPAFAAIAAGGFHSCGLTTDGQAFCWGANTFGQLGIGATGTDAPPARVDTDLRFAALSGGELHTCGVTTDGIGYCWGSNREGQLGSRFEVTPVPEPIQFEGES